MRLFGVRKIWLAYSLAVIPLLGGCSGSMMELDSPEHTRLLQEDRNAVRGPVSITGERQVMELSLPDAIRRGYTHNLDARVAALEELSQQDSITIAKMRALPGVEASRGYVGRSNVAASSSRSILTGQESLEPSQSTEEDRRVAALEANWNLLDAALALADAAKADDEAKIASERYAKVIQNVEQDVYAAYWRALAYQDSRGRLQSLMKDGAAQIEKLDRAATQKLVSGDQAGEKMAILSDRIRTLRDLHDRAQLAEVELKSMLSIPMETQLVLTTKRKDIDGEIRRLLDEDVMAQEWRALQSRPEMREEILKKNMTIADTRREIIQTLPGINLLLSKEYDSNKFLVDHNWSNFSAEIVQSITNIVTLPDRYRAAKNKEAVADARRQALSSALIAQVHIARDRLASTKDASLSGRLAQRAAARKSHAAGGKASEGLAAGQDALLARIDHEIETLRANMAYADMQDAYAAMNATMGRGASARPVTLAAAKEARP